MTDQNSAAGNRAAETTKAAAPSITQTLVRIPGPMWLVLAGMLINRLATFLQLYLVLYLTARGFTAPQAGLALGAYGIGSVVGVLLGGAASDRIGYAWTIVGSMALAGLGTLSLVRLHSLPAIVAVALGIGLMAQMYRPAASALLVERTPEQYHVMVFAVYRMAFNLGTTVGPLLGALLISHSYDLIFYVEAAGQVGFALLALILARSGGSPHSAAGPRTVSQSRSYAAVLKDRRYTLFLLALFLNAVVYIQQTSALPLQLRVDGHSVTFYSSLLSLNAVMVIALELLFTKYVQRLPGRVAVALGIGLVGVGMNLYVAGPAIGICLAATVVWTLGEMIGTPTASAWPARVAPERLRGRYIAASQFPFQFGYAVGPVLGVAVWQVSHAAVWWLCGLLTVAAVAAGLTGMAEPESRAAAPASGEPITPTASVPADSGSSRGSE